MTTCVKTSLLKSGLVFCLLLVFLYFKQGNVFASCGVLIFNGVSSSCSAVTGGAAYAICSINGSGGATTCCSTASECSAGSTGGVCGEEYNADPGCPANCPVQIYSSTSPSAFGLQRYCCGIDSGNFAGDRCVPPAPTRAPQTVACGDTFLTSESATRVCPVFCPGTQTTGASGPVICCGVIFANQCYAQMPSATPTQVAQPTVPPAFTPDPVQHYEPPANSLFLYRVNPLTVTGNSNPLLGFFQGVLNLGTFSTPAGFMNALLVFLFPLAGMILFVMIVWGGFEMVMGAADTKAQEAGKHRITAALIGFTLLFVSYWIVQIIQQIFGLNILR